MSADTFMEKMKEFETTRAKVKQLFADDRYAMAVGVLKQLKEDMKDDAAFRKLVKSDVVLSEVEEMGQEMCDLVASVAPNTLGSGGWKPISAEPGCDHVFYRDENGDDKDETKVGKMSFRVEGFVEAPLLNLASLIYELDLWPKWFPGMVKASNHAELSKFRVIPVLESWLPWPLANRHLKLKAYGDVYDGDSVAIYARDLQAKDLAGTKIEMPKSPDGTVDLVLYFAGFHVIPCSKDVSYLKAIFCLDPQLDLLPNSLMNYIISKTAGVLLSLIRKHVKKKRFEGSEYETRMKSKPVYDEMRKRLKEMESGKQDCYTTARNRYLEKDKLDAFDARAKSGDADEKKASSGGSWLWGS